MNILDFSTTHAQETDEIINVSDSNPVNLAHDIFYNKTGKLVTVFTASGGGGTELTEGTDFDVGGVFPDGSLPTSISPDVAYTTIEITNATYHDTPLYVNYYPIGDVISAARWNTSTLPGQVDAVSADTTISGRTALRIVQVTTGATHRTVTLPSGSTMQTGDEIEVAKVDSGTGKVTIARAGSDTIDGLTSKELHAQDASMSLRWSGSSWQVSRSRGGRPAAGAVRIGSHEYQFTEGNELDYTASFADGGSGVVTFSELPSNTRSIVAFVRTDDSSNAPGIRFSRSSGSTFRNNISSVFADAGSLNRRAGTHEIVTDGNTVYYDSAVFDQGFSFEIFGYKVSE